MYQFPPGSTGISIQYFLRDANNGQAKTGLAYNSPGAAAGYTRQGGVAAGFNPATLASVVAPWASGGFIEIDPVNQPGMYRLDAPNAALAAGVSYVTIALYFTGVIAEPVLILLQAAPTAVGPGGAAFTPTVQRSDNAAPVAGASLWVSTDAAGANVVAGPLPTNALGQATFLLQPGTYYLWGLAPGYNFANPAAFTATAVAGGVTLLATPAAGVALTPAATPHQARFTAHDLQDQLEDYLGADPGENAVRICRRAMMQALREFAAAHRWTYLQAAGRLQANGQYTTGTIQYWASDGTNPYQVTLTGGTWPSWARYGNFRVNFITSKVGNVISPTVLQLQPPLVYELDLPAGTPFTLYRDTYTLPADYVMSDNLMAETIWGQLEYVSPAQWASWVRFRESYGVPKWYTLMGDPDVPGRMCVRIFPFPDVDATIDFVYQRKPRDLVTFDLSAGTASVNALTAPTTITLSQAVLGAAHVGSVIRLAADDSGPPDGLDGLNPYVFEGNVLAVQSPTVCVVDAAVPASYTGVAFRVSDPIDVEDFAMIAAFVRCCEKHAALQRLMKGAPAAKKAYDDALVLAREADARTQARRAAGIGGPYRAQLRFMPRGPDIS